MNNSCLDKIYFLLILACVGVGFPYIYIDGLHKSSVVNTWTEQTVEKIPLVSIRAVDGEVGRLEISYSRGLIHQTVIATGFTDTTPYYFFYKKRVDGGYQMDKVVADTGAAVYEEERQEGILVIITETRMVELEDGRRLKKEERSHFEFHIPRGSITREFKLQ